MYYGSAKCVCTHTHTRAYTHHMYGSLTPLWLAGHNSVKSIKLICLLWQNLGWAVVSGRVGECSQTVRLKMLQYDSKNKISINITSCKYSI